jgi:uncharacterized protein (DUF952 family)
MPPSDYVYKIFAWREAVALMTSGRFHGSPDDLRDGFIHLSEAHQVASTLTRHFRDKPMLFLGFFARERLGERLAMEPSRGGALFPHLYRPLELGELAALVPIPDQREGWRPPHLAPQQPQMRQSATADPPAP